ncbi:MAG: TolC family protein [Verrucomicrobiota bacterium]
MGVVRDGPSWFFDPAAALFQKELGVLAGESYSVRFVELGTADYDAGRMGGLLEEAFARDDLDLLYTSGVIGSQMASRLPEEERTIPVIAAAQVFSDVRVHPLTPEGASARPNYTMVAEPSRIPSDIGLLQQISGASRIDVLVDEALFGQLQALAEDTTARMEEVFGISVRFQLATARAASTLARLPQGVEAMYVSILVRMPEEERGKLYAGLADRGILSVPMLGRTDLELGATASLAIDRKETVARLAALTAHQLLLGASIEDLPVVLPVQDSFVVNAKAAERAGWSVPWKIILESELFGDFGVPGPGLGLVDAMRLAKQNNTDVVVAREEEIIQTEEGNLTRAGLLPRLSSSASYQNSVNNLTNTSLLGLELQQVLFNDELVASLRAQRRNVFSARLDTRSRELDAMNAAAVAYFDALEAEELFQLERENLRLTQNNAQLAETRIEIGSAEQNEIFRWQQAVAQDRTVLEQRNAQRNIEVVELNRVLGQPREKRWSLQPIELDSGETYFLDDYLGGVVKDRDRIEDFRRFLGWFSGENSPELMSFDQLLGGQGLLLRQRQRAFFLPEASGFLNYQRADFGGGLVENTDEVTWGLQIELPLFEGGARIADVGQTKAQIRQLAAQRLQALEQVEVSALSVFESLGANFPAIELSRIALEAAQKNYDAVYEEYSQGSASILSLLDAQDELLSQRQQEVSAVYSYLRTVFDLQRSLAWFEWENSPEDREKFGTLIVQFLAGKFGPLTQPPSESQKEAREVVDSAIQPGWPARVWGRWQGSEPKAEASPPERAVPAQTKTRSPFQKR